jgi:hypothetical protein
MDAVEKRGADTVLRVRVQPRASREGFTISPEGVVRVALSAPPVDGKANKSLITLLAKTLGLPRRSVTLLHGEKSRDKVLLVQGIGPDTVLKRLPAQDAG